MALDGTYTGLVASIADWLNRSDLTDQIADFIVLAEAEMRRELRPAVARASLTLDAAEVTLPSTVAELRSVRPITASPSLDRPLYPRTPEDLAEIRTQLTTSGRPRYFAVVGEELLLVPEPDQSYDSEIVYTEAFTALDSTDDATWGLLTTAPDLYLFGALSQAAPYLEHDERIPVWESRFNRAIAQLNAARERKEAELQLQPMRLPRVF